MKSMVRTDRGTTASCDSTRSGAEGASQLRTAAASTTGSWAAAASALALWAVSSSVMILGTRLMDMHQMKVSLLPAVVVVVVLARDSGYEMQVTR
jgi:hypothetical protein